MELGPSPPVLSLPRRGALGGSMSPSTHTHHRAPHTCSSKHVHPPPPGPPEHGKKHRAAVRVCLPLIRGMVVTAPGPGHGNAGGHRGLNAACARDSPLAQGTQQRWQGRHSPTALHAPRPGDKPPSQAQAPRRAACMCPKASAPPEQSQAQTDTSTEVL